MRALLLAVATLVAAGCGGSPSAEEIKKEIEAARPCGGDPDCVNIGGRCPFGCDIVVNRAWAERVRKLVNDYPKGCAQSCGPPPAAIVCESGLCAGKP
jgi:hypothetical protein